MCEKGANKPEVVSYYTTIQVIITVAPGNLAGEIYFKFLSRLVLINNLNVAEKCRQDKRHLRSSP